MLNHFKNYLFLIPKHWYLIRELIRRDIAGRYRGSTMGLFWSFLNPVMMLMVYTFFFSIVFKARWGGLNESKGEFALILFSGLIVLNFFAECVGRAPGLVVSNSNYVKKIVFPVEVLILVAAGSALFHAAISLLVWSVFAVFIFGGVKLSILLLPIVFFPLCLLTIGASWIVASLGVYLRDIGQFVSIFIAILPFTAPIFFPMSSLPEAYRLLVYLNPLTASIEHIRQVLIWGSPPSWGQWVLTLVLSSAFSFLGYIFFMKTKKGFADVL